MDLQEHVISEWAEATTMSMLGPVTCSALTVIAPVFPLGELVCFDFVPGDQIRGETLLVPDRHLGDGDQVPIGYYTLAATSIALAELPEALAKRLPRYPVVPATLMGRLAVDARHQREGHGEFMLFDAFSRVLRNDIASYAFVVDAKDDKAAQFYQRYRFRFLVEGSRRLFIPMAEIAKLFS